MMLTPVVGNAQDFSYIDTKMDSVMDLPQWSRDVDCSNYDYATTIPGQQVCALQVLAVADSLLRDSYFIVLENHKDWYEGWNTAIRWHGWGCYLPWNLGLAD